MCLEYIHLRMIQSEYINIDALFVDNKHVMDPIFLFKIVCELCLEDVIDVLLTVHMLSLFMRSL